MGLKNIFKNRQSENNKQDEDLGFFPEEIEDVDPFIQPLDDDPPFARDNETFTKNDRSFPDGFQNEENADHRLSEIPEALPGPLGLDIGTANLVTAQYNGKDIRTFTQLNAFYTVPYSNITKQTLLRDDIPFFQKDGSIYVLGYHSEDFAAMLGGETRRPIESGILNPKEEEAVGVIRALINGLVKKARTRGEKICFSVPGEPLEGGVSVFYHESIISMQLRKLGYSPVSINEGLAVVLSELLGNKYTGIGISMGGGMCNVCFSYLSVPVITFSIQKGGDYIDAMVGRSVGEPATKVKRIKEQELDLSKEPGDRIETGLHIFYHELFNILIKSLRQVMGASDKLPRLSKAVPIVLSGGTVLPKGTRDVFIRALRTIRLPVKISEIFITEKPLYATAKGALVMIGTEEAEI